MASIAGNKFPWVTNHMATTASAASLDREKDTNTGAETPQIQEAALRSTIASISQLPADVSSTSQLHISDRILDKELYQSLLGQRKTFGADGEWTERLKRRRKNLTQFVGHRLVCVLIRLPGVHYTVEINPSGMSVVHWEWQPT